MLAVLAAGVAGCGGADKKPTDTVARVPGAPTAGATTPPPVSPAPSTSTTPATPPPTSTSPQTAPGSGGGTEPARTELTFTGVGTRLTPQRASVAPFVSVQVTLITRDGSAHILAIGGTTLSVASGHPRASARLPGLRPGRSYLGHADRGQTVRILSTSEPGP